MLRVHPIFPSDRNARSGCASCFAFTERTSICIMPDDLLTVNNDRCIRIIMLLKHSEPKSFSRSRLQIMTAWFRVVAMIPDWSLCNFAPARCLPSGFSIFRLMTVKWSLICFKILSTNRFISHSSKTTRRSSIFDSFFEKPLLFALNRKSFSRIFASFQLFVCFLSLRSLFAEASANRKIMKRDERRWD